MRKEYKPLLLTLTVQEHEYLKRQADLAGMKMNPLVKQLIMGVQLRPRPPDQYAELLRELAAIGNNINQIAYWANARKAVSNAEIQEAAALAKQAWRLVKDGL